MQCNKCKNKCEKCGYELCEDCKECCNPKCKRHIYTMDNGIFKCSCGLEGGEITMIKHLRQVK